NGDDDFRATGQVCRAGPKRARAAEQSLPLKFMPFDILFFDGKPVWQGSYDNRYQLLCEQIGCTMISEYIVFPETFETFEEAKRAVRKYQWEGLVCWDRQASNE